MIMDNLKDLDSKTLFEMLANAVATSSCGGHHKGDMNDAYAKAYAEELNSRGYEVNLSHFAGIRAALSYLGTFNGRGSY